MKKLKLILRQPQPFLKKISLLGLSGVSMETAPKYPASLKELVEEIRDSHYVISDALDYKNEAVFEQCRNLEYIGLTISDYSCVDLALAEKRGITVSNAHGYASQAVAEFVFCQLLNFYRRPAILRMDEWGKRGGFEAEELGGKKLGILGFGSIGKKIAEIGKAFGMNVFYWDRKREDAIAGYRELDKLLADAEIVVIALPGTAQTRGFFDREKISALGNSAVVVNIARGSIVVEAALANALNEGKIRGAIVDVFSKEPPQNGDPLLTARNALLTPHIAWNTKQAREMLAEVVAKRFEEFIHNKNTCANENKRKNRTRKTGKNNEAKKRKTKNGKKRTERGKKKKKRNGK